ncbi:MAG: hypothetical protein ACUVV4_01910 [Candidatus Bathyarchaeia archaeon]
MWLVILSMAAALSTAIWYSKAENDFYMLRLLSLILWGASLMVFVDHVMGYFIDGGEFFEMSAEAIVLGFVLLITALVAWEIILLIKDPKNALYKRKNE